MHNVQSPLLYLFVSVAVCLTLTACQSSEDADVQADSQAQTQAADVEESPPPAVSPAARTSQDVKANKVLELPDTPYYAIETSMGRMVVRLYEDTPKHRRNFKKLVAKGFYDGTTFHRVIEGFMIQGGDPNTRDDYPRNDGNGGPGYTIPAEINPQYFHKRGALAAARLPDSQNPERRSSGSQFYIVDGQTYSDAQLNVLEKRLQKRLSDSTFAFSEEARAAYTTIGGAPHLDMQYTVFGELVEGFDVLDRIAALETPRSRGVKPSAPGLIDHPYEEVTMEVYPLPDYSVEIAS